MRVRSLDDALADALPHPLALAAHAPTITYNAIINKLLCLRNITYYINIYYEITYNNTVMMIKYNVI